MFIDATESKLRSIVSMGWIISVLLQIADLVVRLSNAAILDDFSGFLFDPGEVGLKAFAVVVCVHAILILSIQLTDAIWFRWLNVILLPIFCLLFMAHQIFHLISGGMVPAAHMIVTTQYLIGFVVTVYAVKWARAGKK
ncbi:MAG: hypothetical protein V4568_13640 [Pseudomonadota bacterium]